MTRTPKSGKEPIDRPFDHLKMPRHLNDASMVDTGRANLLQVFGGDPTALSRLAPLLQPKKLTADEIDRMLPYLFQNSQISEMTDEAFDRLLELAHVVLVDRKKDNLSNYASSIKILTCGKRSGVFGRGEDGQLIHFVDRDLTK